MATKVYFNEMVKVYRKPKKGWRQTFERFPEMICPPDFDPEQPNYTLNDFEDQVKLVQRNIMEPFDRYYILYNFFYGHWIQAAFDRF